MRGETAKPRISILGTRGIPARHGGFETFAERLALYLVNLGWEVTVYCQVTGKGPLQSDSWRGVLLVKVPVLCSGAMGTVLFDWRAALHAARHGGLLLTLGYNTACFMLLSRLGGRINLINMDGIEWRRDKWGPLQKLWLYLNERAGARIGNHLIADNPEIARHLAAFASVDKITMIPYGADHLEAVDPAPLASLGVVPQAYALIIARPEPENSILEMVKAFCSKPRDCRLVVLGNFTPEANSYHRVVMNAADEKVLFCGAIYDQSVVEALRCHCRIYLHGHRVGGTNPSLVEALGASSPVLAHDNPFNRWVAGGAGRYFQDETDCAALLDSLLADQRSLEEMRQAARSQHRENFQWERVLEQYRALFDMFLNG